VNHIIAALFAIGILFGIWTGIDKAADATQVQSTFTELSTAMAALPEPAETARLRERLDAVSTPLDALTAETMRLPRDLAARLASMKEELAAVQAALPSEPTETPPEALGSALSALRTDWQAVQGNAQVTQKELTVTSLSVQGSEVFKAIANRAEASVNIAILLIGIMAFWLGVMRVAEEAGIVQFLANLIRPFFNLLFPQVPKEHPANGAILMSIAANVMGLDNAATPLSIKAMQHLQTLNLNKDTITNAQGTLLVLNATSINFIPFSIIAYRLTYSSQFPNDIIIPTIIATGASTVTGIIAWSILKRMSRDPAAVGEEALRITREVNASLRPEKEEQS
jgi:spore maturation protein A